MVNKLSPATLRGPAKSRRAMGWLGIDSETAQFEPHEGRQHDDDHEHREYAQHQRHGELCRQAVGLLLGARQPLVAHVVAVDAKRLGHAGAEFFGLLQKGREGTCLLETKPVAEVLKSLAERTTRTHFES